jgi:hypothetical protein
MNEKNEEGAPKDVKKDVLDAIVLIKDKNSKRDIDAKEGVDLTSIVEKLSAKRKKASKKQ